MKSGGFGITKVRSAKIIPIQKSQRLRALSLGKATS